MSTDQRSVARGLQILNGYKSDGETWECDAQHDELHATGPAPEDLSGEDAKELRDLGWLWTGTSWRRFT